MHTYAEQARLEPADTWLGFKQLLPLSFFVAAFGLAFGLAAAQEGLSEGNIVLMSALVFAGTSQFAALELWGTQVPLVPLIITTFAINARHLLMGASLYPWLQHISPLKRYGIMLLASDANWAMAMQGFHKGERALGILLGGGLAIWSFWMLGTWLGLYFGSAIEDPFSIGLDMVLGCFLLAMALGGRKDLRILVIWCVAGISSMMAYWWLPANSHVVVGALSGGLVGALWMEKEKK
ncbi:AzlC family ABC transporter permease [Oceanisphaera psychrotolerans]|uniref:Branched-chain amino acid ABC transporter permease n=1 Tax=Oceanisphaera psychrotolerans TaxID=1414654 RepID=A0A1J4QF99_9GAMM|nr:AzlC family ABC transporter permease [Oceanisphaera psychrotolerans]OIN12168.1 branched-chain amino acid ABC transporter permease [Oceanisphaera psychrotolerans]